MPEQRHALFFRHLQVDLESIWQATNADNIRMREQLIDMRVAS